jgi:hypothetical protein
MMTNIFIISERHDDKDAMVFKEKAIEFINNSQSKVLFLEGVSVDEYPGYIQDNKNLYALESNVLWAFSNVVDMTAIIHQLTTNMGIWTGDAEFGNNSLHQVYCNAQENIKKHIQSKVAEFITHLHDIDEKLQQHYSNLLTYEIFVNNLGEIVRIFDYPSQISKVEKAKIFCENILSIKSALEEYALFLAENIRNDFIFPDSVKNHESVSEDWINQFFNLNNPSKNDVDVYVREAAVGLRNQFYIETIFNKLPQIPNKDIWVIVGADHAEDMQTLILTMDWDLEVEIIEVDDKQNRRRDLIAVPAHNAARVTDGWKQHYERHEDTGVFRYRGIRLKEFDNIHRYRKGAKM